MEETSAIAIQTKKPDPPKPTIKRVVRSQVPASIMEDPELIECMKILPENYNFEIQKSIWRIQQLKEELKKEHLLITLQFPEGLMIFACIIVDILRKFTECEFIIAADVTYGACCIDDVTAKAMGSDFMIHYAHSCLIPIQDMTLKVQYVFVDIQINIDHFIATWDINFSNEKHKTYFLLGTIQFNASLWKAKEELSLLGYNINIPQERPRCAGESLGCTSPVLDYEANTKDTVIYLCDGRFHMEAVMIANPKFKFFQYNPYNQELTIEKYDFEQMIKLRKRAIEKSLNSLKLDKENKKIGLIQSVLGRQGSPHILDRMIKSCKEKGIEHHVQLISEIMPDIQKAYEDEFEFFVQIGCPRLSIDWGDEYHKPVLTPYEFWALMGKVEWSDVSYPMDYYSDKGGEWSNYWHRQMDKKSKVSKLRKPKVELKLEEN